MSNIRYYTEPEEIKQPLIIENCYLYSLWSGRLKIDEGEVYELRKRDDKLAVFRRKKGDGCTVSRNEKEVYNAVVWLKERNDNEAIQILMDNQQKSIDMLEEKIANHKFKIQILKNSIIDND